MMHRQKNIKLRYIYTTVQLHSILSRRHPLPLSQKDNIPMCSPIFTYSAAV